MAVEKKSPQKAGKNPTAAERKGIDYKNLRTLASHDTERAEEQLHDFHEAIDKVKLAYHLYFIGTQAKPPRDERAKLDRHARDVQQHMPSRTMDRFKMQSALIRYMHFCELWDKSIRKLEEGERIPWVAISRQAEEQERAAQDARAASPAAKPESSPALARLKDPMQEPDEVRKIWNSFVAAKKKVGEDGDIPFEKFQAAIARQTTALLSKGGAASVQYRIEIVDNKVAIKAKPLKPEDE